MPLRGGWRSNKQPPKTREPQKPSKKGLEDTCLEMKKTLAQERLEKLEAQKREENRAMEEELMAMTYGPNWKTKMPAWAAEFNKTPIENADREPFQDSDDEDDDEEVVVPMVRHSEVRLKKKAS